MVNQIIMERFPSPKRNKRLMYGSSHVGGGTTNKDSDVPSTIHSRTNSYEISNEEVQRRRIIRENREDIAAAFGNGY